MDNLMKPVPETPLTVEALLWALTQRGCMTVAGYNGSCERVIRFDELVAALESLRKRA
jgi:hypothetical protein